MSQVTACRACLVENLTLYRVTNSPYEEIYEKLTNAKLGKVYPDTFCYICMSVLRKFRNFATLAQHSNIKLKQWYKSEIDRKPTTQPLFTISTTTVEYVSMAHDENEDKALTIKIENTDDTAEDQTNEMQYIESTRESEIYSQPADTTNMDATNAMGSDSWSDAEQKPGPASDEEFEVPIVKQEPRKRAVKVEKTPKGNPGIKKNGSDKQKKNEKVVDKKITEKKEKNSIRKDNKLYVKLHSCEFCAYKTPRRYRLFEHLKRKHTNKDEKGKMNKEIDTKTPRKYPKNTNVKPYQRKNIICDYCEYKTFQIGRLRHHLNKKHDIEILTCNFCNYVAPTQNNLLKHKIKHHAEENKFICDTCGFKTYAKRYIEKHMQIHFDKTIKCQFCSYKCTRREYLANHIAVKHKKEKNFMCHFCDYRCSIIARLRRHLTIHNSKDKRRFKCEFCGQRFTRNEHLQRHVRIHTGEKPFACPECGQRFNQDNAMKLHLKRHYK